MAIQMRGGGDISSGSKWLNDAGSYHLLITDATETPEKADAETLFGVTVSVLAGTVAHQENKCANIKFKNPDMLAADKVAREQKKIDRLCIAAGLVSRQDVLSGKPYAIDMELLKGRQIFATFCEFVGDDNKKRVTPYDNFFHVDDLEAENIPRSAAHIRLINPELRWNAKQQEAARTAAMPAVTPAPAAASSAPQQTYDPSNL